MTNLPLTFRVHAIQRMFERKISAENVRQVLRCGEMIEDYADEMPHPGGLILGKHGRRPIHVVMAENSTEREVVIITVYEPNPARWKSDFRSRKE